MQRLMQHLTCSPALWERDTAFAFALPLSFPALPPACTEQKPVYAQLCWKDNKEGFVHPRRLKLTVHSKLRGNISIGCENSRLTSEKRLFFLCAVRDSCNPFKYYEFPANGGPKGDSRNEGVSPRKAPEMTRVTEQTAANNNVIDVGCTRARCHP